jgi:hypothetical protein
VITKVFNVVGLLKGDDVLYRNTITTNSPTEYHVNYNYVIQVY